MQERSLKALGEEYERTAMLVKERIARKRSELRRLGLRSPTKHTVLRGSLTCSMRSTVRRRISPST